MKALNTETKDSRRLDIASTTSCEVKVKDFATNPAKSQSLNIASPPEHSVTKQSSADESARDPRNPRDIYPREVYYAKYFPTWSEKDIQRHEARLEAQRRKDALNPPWNPHMGIDRPVPTEYWNERGAKMRRRAAMRRLGQILLYGLLAILVLIVVGIVLLIYYTVRHFQSK